MDDVARGRLLSGYWYCIYNILLPVRASVRNDWQGGEDPALLYRTAQGFKAEVHVHVVVFFNPCPPRGEETDPIRQDASKVADLESYRAGWRRSCEEQFEGVSRSKVERGVIQRAFSPLIPRRLKSSIRQSCCKGRECYVRSAV
jgi:hypothetical protein